MLAPRVMVRGEKVSMGLGRCNKTTSEEIGHLSNPSEGGSGKGTFTGLLNPSQGATNAAPLVVDKN